MPSTHLHQPRPLSHPEISLRSPPRRGGALGAKELSDMKGGARPWKIAPPPGTWPDTSPTPTPPPRWSHFQEDNDLPRTKVEADRSPWRESS